MKFIANVSWCNVTFGTYTGVPENPFSTASFYRQPVISATEFSKYNFQLTWLRNQVIFKSKSGLERSINYTLSRFVDLCYPLMDKLVSQSHFY